MKKNQMSYRTLFAACAVLAFGAAGPASASTASVEGAWDDTATWGGEAVPTSADDVVISDGVVVWVPPGVAAVCNKLTLSPQTATTAIELDEASSSLTTGSVLVDRSTGNGNAWIDVGDGTFTAGSLTLGNALATTDGLWHTDLVIAAGSATISGDLTTYSNAARITFSDEGSLKLGGSVIQYGNLGAVGGRMTFVAATSTVTYDGSGAQTVANLAYHNLALDGSGAKAMGVGVAVTERLTIAPSGSAMATLADGVNFPMANLALGSVGQVNGTWGSTGAPAATHQNDTYFDAASSGILTVAKDSSPSAKNLLSFSWDTYFGKIDEASQT